MGIYYSYRSPRFWFYIRLAKVVIVREYFQQKIQLSNLRLKYN